MGNLLPASILQWSSAIDSHSWSQALNRGCTDGVDMVVQIYFLSISFLGLLLNQELSLNEYYCLSRLWDLHPWGF